MEEINAQSIHTGMKSTLTEWGLNEHFARYVADFSSLFIILASSIVVYYVAKIIINQVLKKLVQRSASKWDDHLYEQRVFTRMAMLLPALVLQVSLDATITEYPEAIRIISLGLRLYMILIILLVIVSFLNAVYRIYGEFEMAESKPIKGYIQIAKIVIYILAGLSIISVLIGQSPLTLIAGLGAMSAVLMLIFKDSILGFVAGVQLTNNKMLHLGDWITMPQNNTDGTVIDISLVTVKVRNFDNSVSCIPTYTLISDSFQNWRSMGEAGGRRMKRSILIDVGTIRFANEALFAKLRANRIHVESETGQDINATNLELFRRHIHGYLKTVPNLNQDASLMVRTMQPTENGLPVELYAYYNPPNWSEFEDFQARLFEHIFAILPLFDLKAFQRPSGRDVQMTGILPE
jgi:miniconductance mechanosensitive channel